MEREKSHGTRLRRGLASSVAIVLISLGTALGFLFVLHVGLLLKGGLSQVEYFWRNNTIEYGWLTMLAGILGGAIGAGLGAWSWFLIMRGTRLITEEEIVRFLGVPRGRS